MNGQQQQQLPPDILDKADDLKCNDCGNLTWTAAFVLKTLSPLISPTGKETFIPVQVFICSKCGSIPENFLSAFKALTDPTKD